eukprot:15459810-Alexandrium_andersonii.AAC.1
MCIRDRSGAAHGNAKLLTVDKEAGDNRALEEITDQGFIEPWRVLMHQNVGLAATHEEEPTDCHQGAFVQPHEPAAKRGPRGAWRSGPLDGAPPRLPRLRARQPDGATLAMNGATCSLWKVAAGVAADYGRIALSRFPAVAV